MNETVELLLESNDGVSAVPVSNDADGENLAVLLVLMEEAVAHTRVSGARGKALDQQSEGGLLLPPTAPPAMLPALIRDLCRHRLVNRPVSAAGQ